MEANQLRIGNFVNTSERGSGAYQICRQGTIRTINNGSCNITPFGCSAPVVTVNFKNVEPVPLTEEWLLRFGFEGKVSKISNCGNYYLNYDAEYGRHDMALWYQKGSWCFSHTKTFTVLKYVHSLQNLFFALTGEELTIKLVR